MAIYYDGFMEAPCAEALRLSRPYHLGRLLLHAPLIVCSLGSICRRMSLACFSYGPALPAAAFCPECLVQANKQTGLDTIVSPRQVKQESPLLWVHYSSQTGSEGLPCPRLCLTRPSRSGLIQAGLKQLAGSQARQARNVL